MFAELARKFQPLVDALGEISDSARIWSQHDILRLYEIWLKTGSRRAHGLLQQLGVTPSPARWSGTEGTTMLRPLQQLLETIYDAPTQLDVTDFLFTHRSGLPPARRQQAADEEVIVVEEEDCATIGLYLDAGLLQRLQRADPLDACTAATSPTCGRRWKASAISAYLSFKVGHDRPVSQLELELQAEVDKYVVSLWLLREQHPRRFPRELHPLLFTRTRRSADSTRHGTRCIARANRLAARFCSRLERAFASDRRVQRTEPSPRCGASIGWAAAASCG